MLENLKKYKSQIALVSTMMAMGGTLFAKIDAYAQSKVDAGVEALRVETAKEVMDVKADIKILKVKQDDQQKQLDRMETKQDDVIHLLLEMKQGKK